MPRRTRRSLPFGDGLFDSTYCVAVLQHIRDVGGAVAELARVTRVGGRLLIVEPDNAARYWFSSLASGMEAFAMGQRFFTALALARGESPAAQTGPLVAGPAARARHPCRSRCSSFPVTVSHLGPPDERAVGARAGRRSPRRWQKRRTSRCAGSGPTTSKAIDQYARDAAARRHRPSSRSRTRCCSRRSVSGPSRDRSRRRVGLGRIRAVLRLGERADRRAARRRLLVPARRRTARTDSRARVRHRPHRAADRQVRHADSSGIDRSGADARSRPAAGCGAPGWPIARCSCAATSARCRSGRRTGFGCVMAPYGVLQSMTRERDLQAHARRRSPASSAAAGCSRSTSCPTCRAGRNTAAARACAGGMPAGTLTLIESVRQEPRARADDLRPGVRRAARRRAARPSFRADVPHALRAADDAPARTGGLLRSMPCSATTRAGPGTRAPTRG